MAAESAIFFVFACKESLGHTIFPE